MGKYLEDLFTDDNGVEVADHTIPTKRGSQVWLTGDAFGGSGAADANVVIQGNRARFTAAHHVVTVDLGTGDLDVVATWEIGGTTGQRIWIPLRYADKNNNLALNIREPAGQKDATLYQHIAGVQTTLATATGLTLDLSTTKTVRVLLSGTSVTCWLNGSLLFGGAVTVSSSVTGTRFGLGVAGMVATCEFSDIVFTNNVANAVSAASDITVGSNLALTLSGFVAAPTSVTYRGVTEAFSGSPSSSAATLAAIPMTDFVPGGAHEETGLETDYDLVVSDGIDSATVALSLLPSNPNHYGTLLSGFDTGYAPAGAAIGDVYFADVAELYATVDPALAIVQPLVFPLDVPVHVWDGAAWLYELLEFTAEETTEYAFYDAFTDTNGTAPADHTPNIDDYGGGWSAVEKEYTGAPTHTDGVTIEDGELVISSDRGVSVDVGNTVQVARVLWRVDASGDSLVIGIARKDLDNQITCWLREEGTQNAYLIQHHNGADVPGSTVVSHTFVVGQIYLVQVERLESGLIELRIDGDLKATLSPAFAVNALATRVGVYANTNTSYLPAFAVNAELPTGPVLSFDAETYNPGDTVTGTITDGPLANATYDGTLNGVAISFSSRTTTGFTFVAPDYDDLDAAGDHIGSGFYRNLVVALDDGVDQPQATLQLVPHEESRFGTIVAPSGDVPSGTELGDEGYLHVTLGDIESADPSTMSVDIKEKTAYYSKAFGLTSQQWRSQVLVEIKIAKAMKTTRQEVQRIFAMSGVKKQVINTYVMIDGQRVKLW